MSSYNVYCRTFLCLQGCDIALVHVYFIRAVVSMLSVGVRMYALDDSWQLILAHCALPPLAIFERLAGTSVLNLKSVWSCYPVWL